MKNKKIKLLLPTFAFAISPILISASCVKKPAENFEKLTRKIEEAKHILNSIPVEEKYFENKGKLLLAIKKSEKLAKKAKIYNISSVEQQQLDELINELNKYSGKLISTLIENNLWKKEYENDWEELELKTNLLKSLGIRYSKVNSKYAIIGRLYENFLNNGGRDILKYTENIQNKSDFKNTKKHLQTINEIYYVLNSYKLKIEEKTYVSFSNSKKAAIEFSKVYNEFQNLFKYIENNNEYLDQYVYFKKYLTSEKKGFLQKIISNYANYDVAVIEKEFNEISRLLNVFKFIRETKNGINFAKNLILKTANEKILNDVLTKYQINFEEVGVKKEIYNEISHIKEIINKRVNEANTISQLAKIKFEIEVDENSPININKFIQKIVQVKLKTQYILKDAEFKKEIIKKSKEKILSILNYLMSNIDLQPKEKTEANIKLINDLISHYKIELNKLFVLTDEDKTKLTDELKNNINNIDHSDVLLFGINGYTQTQNDIFINNFIFKLHTVSDAILKDIQKLKNYFLLINQKNKQLFSLINNLDRTRIDYSIYEGIENWNKKIVSNAKEMHLKWQNDLKTMVTKYHYDTKTNKTINDEFFGILLEVNEKINELEKYLSFFKNKNFIKNVQNKFNQAKEILEDKKYVFEKADKATFNNIQNLYDEYFKNKITVNIDKTFERIEKLEKLINKMTQSYLDELTKPLNKEIIKIEDINFEIPKFLIPFLNTFVEKFMLNKELNNSFNSNKNRLVSNDFLFERIFEKNTNGNYEIKKTFLESFNKSVYDEMVKQQTLKNKTFEKITKIVGLINFANSELPENLTNKTNNLYYSGLLLKNTLENIYKSYFNEEKDNNDLEKKGLFQLMNDEFYVRKTLFESILNKEKNSILKVNEEIALEIQKMLDSQNPIDKSKFDLIIQKINEIKNLDVNYQEPKNKWVIDKMNDWIKIFNDFKTINDNDELKKQLSNFKVGNIDFFANEIKNTFISYIYNGNILKESFAKLEAIRNEIDSFASTTHEITDPHNPTQKTFLVDLDLLKINNFKWQLLTYMLNFEYLLKNISNIHKI